MTLQEIYLWAREAWVVWMMLLFSGIIFWAFRPKNKDRFERNGLIPFKDESNGG
ncbi:MAG: cbb3-type cytochrome c oxidase subunit 3 [Magnetospirillum sp. WYHS-4]